MTPFLTRLGGVELTRNSTSRMARVRSSKESAYTMVSRRCSLLTFQFGDRLSPYKMDLCM